MWILYQVLMALALLMAGPFLLLGRGFRHLPAIPRRLGRYESPRRRGALWIHAVSVGEVGVAKTLIEALPSDLPILVTTVTPTGQERATATLGGRATVAYLPYDLGFAVRSFFRTFAPSCLILTEGDFWPLVLRAARKRDLPVAVINGRVSDRSFGRLRKFRWFLGPMFDPVGGFGMQTEEDRRRLIELAVPVERVITTGNLKFETAEPPPDSGLEEWVSRLADGRPVLVAGSTMAGEEEAVLDAFESVAGHRAALLLLAPRHPERWSEVSQLLERRRLTFARRSESRPVENPEVALLDTLGELAGAYRWCTAAFIGGTLVPTGGHNPLEAARFSVPVVVGPSMENFRQIADEFDRDHAWRRVRDAGELARTWRNWIDEPTLARQIGRRGADVVDRNRGSIDRTLKMLAPLLQQHVEGSVDG